MQSVVHLIAASDSIPQSESSHVQDPYGMRANVKTSEALPIGTLGSIEAQSVNKLYY